MLKKLTLSTILLSTLLFNGCGSSGGNSLYDPIQDKKYLIILLDIQANICESSQLKDVLLNYGYSDFLTKETDDSTSCKTYGRENDNYCSVSYIGDGNKNCVIGINKVTQQNNTEITDITESTSSINTKPISIENTSNNDTQVNTTEDNNQCGNKKYCNQMNNCDEAFYYYEVCNLSRLDADKDGIPCESICN